MALLIKKADEYHISIVFYSMKPEVSSLPNQDFSSTKIVTLRQEDVLCVAGGATLQGIMRMQPADAKRQRDVKGICEYSEQLLGACIFYSSYLQYSIPRNKNL